MKPLWLSSITGLFQELYQPDTKSMLATSLNINGDLLDSGQLFWSSIFKRDRIRHVINSLEINIHNPAHQLPQFYAVLGNKEKFITNVLDCRISVCDQGIDAKCFFSKLETLSILCELYSRFEFSPFRLTIQNAFVLNEVSASEIVFNCLSIASNPYLLFVNNIIVPLILKFSPGIIFCTGRASFFNIAVAMIVKMHINNVHICLTRHSSEYYSLNKVEKYLTNNTILFSVFDSVILEYFDEYEQILLKTIEKNADISILPNIITAKDIGKTKKIRHRSPKGDAMPLIVRRKEQVKKLKISPERIYDVHFEPYKKCFWDKCVFCGINKKYTFKDRIYNNKETKSKIKKLCSEIPRGSFLWFIDEAINPFDLEILADYFTSNDLNYIWQVRSRIDNALLERGLPEKLSCSGLNELRLGLESASLRILKLMNKFDNEFGLKLVEEIVKTYTGHGISIHFPMIIGFPGEEVADRQMTYDFLSTMRAKYSLFTFNINIFSFDISSPLFNLWDKHSISNIYFPCTPEDFIGNIINWNGPTKVDERVLENERNLFMRNKLYPWMPKKTFIKPTIFYRLSETIRNTLIWKSTAIFAQKGSISSRNYLKRAPNIIISSKTDGEYLAYNWDTHHYIEGDGALISILNAWETPKSINQGIKDLSEKNDKVFYKNDIAILVKKMLEHGHLVETDSCD